MKCSVCDFEHENQVINFGQIPLCDALKDSSEDAKLVTSYAVEVVKCPKCGHSELVVKPPEEEIYSNYTYRTSLSPTLEEHFAQYSESLLKFLSKSMAINDIKFLDIGGNDGVLAKKMCERNIKAYIVDPSPTALLADKKIEVINTYFEKSQAELLLKKVGKFELITCNNCIANIRDLKSFAKNASSLLKANGIICIETGYINSQVQTKTIEMINHEHYHYFSINSIKELFKPHGVKILKWDLIETKGGSIRVYGIKENGEPKKSELNIEIPNEELKSKELSDYIELRRREIAKIVNEKVIYFGSAGSTISIYVFGLQDKVKEVIDDNESRHGKYMPGTGARVISASSWYKQDDDVCINFAWRFGSMIRSRHSNNKGNNHRIVDIIVSSDKK